MKYDDFIVGETFKTKSLHITEEEIIQFATTFDPQYMHIDKEKAEQSRFKGIIASGMHTLSISFKLWVEEGKYGEEVVAGTQMNNVKFIKPVYPGNTFVNSGLKMLFYGGLKMSFFSGLRLSYI
ncbi:MaoC/PaaZ C-terminal domain-containing protein [Staphylococcus aureus]|uniref:MaoC/PaaZ C-terminal domain-containing protein n=1 Tax=Staphylococcus aureus TaxID=1280 RepID=UPI0013F69224|nr:MaoC/PaaZ C-terminal domain-containing protein [Staphylococcus aureus]